MTMAAPPASPRLPLGRIGLVWLLLAMVLLVTGAGNILAGQFPDPDDTLRMVQLRDLLGGQGWFDTTQYRIDPPAGTPMHWSRLVDVPLALVALALQPLLGAASAQMAAAVAVPLLTFGCVVVLAGWIASRFFEDEVVGFAGLACGIVPATIGKFQPLRIDHHGWQVVAVMLATAALFTLRPVKGAIVAGLALAAGLMISIEVLPFAAAFAGVLALGWLREPAKPAALAPFLVALAGGLVALFAITRGPDALAPWCDAIAPAHLAFFAIVAAGSWFATKMRLLRPWVVAGALAVAGGAGLAVFAALSPKCLAAPFGDLDPLVRHYWYDNIFEGLPAWRQSAKELLGNLPQLVAGGVALALLCRASDGDRRRQWGQYLLLYAAACLAGLFVWRSMAFAGALAAVPLGWLIVRGLELLRRLTLGRPAQTKAAALTTAALVMVGSATWLAPSARAHKPAPAQSAPAVRDSSCELNRNAARLNSFGAATVFAPFDIGPALLERTHHATVATSHHRAQAAMHDVITAFMASDDEARAIVANHGASYVVVCTDVSEPRIYAADAPDGLMAHLLAGRAPAWLHPVDVGAPAALKVWQVER